jgi:hypothetical protein
LVDVVVLLPEPLVPLPEAPFDVVEVDVPPMPV